MNQVLLWMTWTAVSHKLRITVDLPWCSQMFTLQFPIFFILLHVALCLVLVHSWTMQPGMPHIFWYCLYYLYSRSDCAAWCASASMIAYIAYAVCWPCRFHPYSCCLYSELWSCLFFFFKSAFTLCDLWYNQSKNNKQTSK